MLDINAQNDELKKVQLSHTGGEIDDNIDEVVEARGEYSNLNERLNNVGDAVSELKSDIADYKNDTVYLEKRNLFDKDNVLVGYFSAGNVGSVLEQKANSVMATVSFEAKPGVKYTVTGVNYNVLAVDENNTVVEVWNGSASTIENYTFAVKSNLMKKVYISFRFASFPIDSYMIVEGESLPEEYISNGYIMNQDYKTYLKGLVNEDLKVYRVGSDKEYTRFYDCIRAIQNDDDKKIIYVDGGVYDIYEELGGDEFTNSIPSTETEWRNISIIIPPNTHIIGLGNVVFEYKPTVITSASSNLVSPLNITDGDFTLENITIVGYSCRYLIHDDGSKDYSNTVHKYKNVCLNKSSGGYPPAFGSGIGNNCQLIFENCNFKSWSTAFSVHNQWWATNALISFDNCILDGELSCRFGTLSGGNTDEEIRVEFKNCYVPTIRYSNENGDETRTIPYNITVLRCGDVTFDSSAFAENQFPPTIYN